MSGPTDEIAANGGLPAGRAALRWWSLVLFLVVFGLLCEPRSTAGEMLIRLKDGKVITVPVDAEEIETITFGAPEDRRMVPEPTAPSKGAAPALPLAPDNLPGTRLAKGNVIRVGPSEKIRLPSQAARVARDSDVVEITGATYIGDVAVWRQSDLTLRGVGGRPHFMAAGAHAGGKAIWVIKGNDVRVENIEFSGARVPDLNGAGIRFEGTNLTISRSYFHDNDR